MSEYKESLFMQRVSLIVLTITLFVALISSGGCSPYEAIGENIKEENFSSGCKVTHANADVGYMTQSGEVGIPCKLKCSKELPKGYCLKYSAKTPYGNCYVQAGSCVTKEESK